VLSWPSPYLPPTLAIEHPPLALLDSYSKQPVVITTKSVASYICGITPYDATHLGHAATYVAYDVAHRYLIAAGHQLHYVQNITDIDDPLFERAARDQIDWRELATSQIDLFQRDMTALRVIPPTNYVKVTEAMPKIIDDIADLVSRGLTYSLAGDIYLDITQVDGAINKLPISLEEARQIFAARGGDPDRPGKRHPLDTLLWLEERANEPSWVAPFGKGRPGWHIECLAIAHNYLPDQGGSAITLQGGGKDLFFPHHYMTNVQSQALLGKPFAALFNHAGMIALGGEKMSKSLGNLIFISELLANGKTPAAIRWALLARHYQEDSDWQNSAFDQAARSLDRLSAALAREEVAPTRPVISALTSALSTNLDTPRALSALMKWCDATEAGEVGGVAGEISRALDLHLGIAL
jgi:L-cysteine:1D-myo-inositol 2-amino-2-deoxy-alpha-D-glucopyranoside ligase